MGFVHGDGLGRSGGEGQGFYRERRNQEDGGWWSMYLLPTAQKVFDKMHNQGWRAWPGVKAMANLNKLVVTFSGT